MLLHQSRRFHLPAMIQGFKVSVFLPHELIEEPQSFLIFLDSLLPIGSADFIKGTHRTFFILNPLLFRIVLFGRFLFLLRLRFIVGIQPRQAFEGVLNILPHGFIDQLFRLRPFFFCLIIHLLKRYKAIRSSSDAINQFRLLRSIVDICREQGRKFCRNLTVKYINPFYGIIRCKGSPVPNHLPIGSAQTAV